VVAAVQLDAEEAAYARDVTEATKAMVQLVTGLRGAGYSDEAIASAAAFTAGVLVEQAEQGDAGVAALNTWITSGRKEAARQQAEDAGGARQ
jgi:hypothetical protein